MWRTHSCVPCSHSCEHVPDPRNPTLHADHNSGVRACTHAVHLTFLASAKPLSGPQFSRTESASRAAGRACHEQVAMDTSRLFGNTRLRLNHREPCYSLEIAVSGDKSCVYGEGGCSYPEIVLIERQAAALLRDFDFRVQIAGGRPDRLTR
jgi:hypothetical protein